MAHVADDARGQGLKIVPVCSYAEAWFRRHKDQQDLLAS
jgi:predicted GNAT family acetyltransferase